MKKIKKLLHIELSDGDTNIVCNPNCPLTDTELINNYKDILIKMDNEYIPSCSNTSWIHEYVNVMCPNYYGYIYTEDKGHCFDCAICEPRKSILNNEHK